MSLRIEVKELTDYNMQNQQVHLSVQGGKAGHLKSTVLNDQKCIWNPSFIIDASFNDILTFSLFTVKQTKRDLIGSAELCCPKFVKIYQKSNVGQTPFQYELDIWFNDKRVGGLSITAVYESGLLFEGEFESQIKLSLRKNKEPVNIFQGKCATRNAFSFMDQTATGQYCKFTDPSIVIQSEIIYQIIYMKSLQEQLAKEVQAKQFFYQTLQKLKNIDSDTHSLKFSI